jgi:hypothetical protein
MTTMIKTIAASAGAMLLFTGSAMALTVTNKDSKEHTIGADAGNSETVHKIAAGATLDLKKDCPEGCGLTGPWGFSWLAKNGEAVTFDSKGISPGAKSGS